MIEEEVGTVIKRNKLNRQVRNELFFKDEHITDRFLILKC